MELQEIHKSIKCVFIGSKSVGKTTLVNSLAWGPNPSEIESFKKFNGIRVEFGGDDGKVYDLSFLDTSSADHQSMIRKVYYEKCDIVLICYSTLDHNSFSDIRRKWHREVKKSCPQKPIIIVANKTDLRIDRVSLMRLDRLQNLKPIETIEGRNLSKSLAAGYVECSASLGDGLRSVFDEIIRIYSTPPVQRYECSCNIL